MRTFLAFLLRRDPVAIACEAAIAEARQFRARALAAERACDELERERDHWRARALHAERQVSETALLAARFRGGKVARA